MGLERCEERALLSVALVSVNAAGTGSGNSGSTLLGGGGSASHNFSADGRYVTFASQATDLVAQVRDDNQASDIFVRDLKAGTTSLVSVAPDGKVGNGPSFDPVISPDGRYIAFVSQATNLATVAPGAPANPSAGAGVLYLRDLKTQTTTLLDVTPDGKRSDGSSLGEFVFSPDGKRLAFTDTSDDLTRTPRAATAPTSPFGPTSANVYLRDLAGQATSLVTVTPDGKLSQGGDLAGSNLVFSPDSKLLAFTSGADDLTNDPRPATPAPAPGLQGGMPPSNLFVRDLSAQSTTLVSVAADGTIAQGSTSAATFSPDGKLVAFASTATDLTGDPGPSAPASPTFNAFGPSGAYVRDLAARKTTLVSITPSGTRSQGDVAQEGPAGGFAFSPDGTKLAFVSTATDLTSNPVEPATTPTPLPLVPPSGTSTPTPVPIDTAVGTTPSFPVMPIVPSSTSVFLRDLTAGTTSLVSVAADGKLAQGFASGPVFSPDGKLLAFRSTATDLTNDPPDSTSPLAPSPLPVVTPVQAIPGNALLAPAVQPAANVTPLATSPTVSIVGPVTALPLNSVVGPSWSNNLFVRDLGAGKTTLVSVTADGKLSRGNVGDVAFGPDGKLLAFTSGADDLTSNPPDITTNSGPAPAPIPSNVDPLPAYPGPTTVPFGFNPTQNLFVRDLAAQATALLSATPDGKAGDGLSASPTFSPDGRTLDFSSTADDLAAGDGNHDQDIFAAVPFVPSSQVRFGSWRFNAKEGDGAATVSVVRDGPTGQAASVGYAVSDGSAKAGVDYRAASGTLTFAPGESSKSIVVPLVPGDHFDGSRTASLTLSQAQGASLGYPTANLILTSDPTTSTPPPPIAPPVAAPTVAPTPTTPPSPVVAPPVATPAPAPAVIQPVAAPRSVPVVAPLRVAPAPVVVGGPKVLGVSALGSRRAVTGLSVVFDKAVAPARALIVSNYVVGLPAPGHGARTGVHPDRVVRIRSASYDAKSHAVTLTLGSAVRIGQAIRLRVVGSPGGLADAAGTPLNSPGGPFAGSDFVTVLTPRPSGR